MSWFAQGNDYNACSDQLIILTSATLVNCHILMIGSVKEASTDIHEAMSREHTAGNNQTRNHADQYQWNRCSERDEMKTIYHYHSIILLYYLSFH